MRTRLRGKLTLLLMAFVLLLAIPAFAFAQDAGSGSSGGSSAAPTIQSDKEDYAPGELVTLTGSNWQPGEKVHINVDDDQTKSWERNVDVVANENGNIRDSFNLPDWFVATYQVTATGETSGVAKTSFTDGNIRFLTTNSDTNFTGSWTKHTNSSCPAGNVGGSSPTSGSGMVRHSAGNTLQVGANAGEFIRITAPATIGNWTFSSWTGPNNFSSTNATLCAPGFAGNGTNDYTANYVQTPTNSAPVIASNNSSVTVDEGQAAQNTGTWSDANANDTVNLSASVGQVTKAGTNASGTWSWSFNTTDGPLQSQPVTITANDGNGGSTQTTFQLTVRNVNPTATFVVPSQAVTAGQNLTLSLNNPDDVSNPDKAAGFTYAFDCGNGYGNFTTTPSTQAGSTQCSTSNAGTLDVGGKIRDKDGGVREYRGSVTVNPAQQATALSDVSGSGTYGGNATLTATLKSGSNPLENKSVEFKLDGNSVGSAQTNAQGVAEKSVSLPNTINAGTHNGAVSASFAGDSGYTGSGPTSGNLTVEKATAQINLGNLTGHTYDGNPKAATATTTPAGLNSVSITYDGESNAPKDAGSYAVVAKLNNPNYNAQDATGTLVIAKADATVEVNWENSTYNGNAHPASGSVKGIGTPPEDLGNPSFTYYSGSNATGTPLSGAPEDAGTYTVKATFNGSSNYKEASATKTITIAKAQAQVSLSNLTHTFDGNAKSATVSTTPSGLNVNVTYNGNSQAPTLVGSYAVQATVNDNNYQGSANDTLTIGAWDARGFHAPVGITNSNVLAPNSSGGVATAPTANSDTTWNTAKGGSTVPLKFHIFAGNTEKTSTGDVKGFNTSQLNSCSISTDEDAVDFVTTGSTSLRYDTTEKQFVQNWKTPTVSKETCFRTTVTFQDNTSVHAFFKLRK